MGSYANLWISDSRSPVDETEVTEEIFMKWDVPLGWLALFEPEDFSLETVEEECDSYQVLYSSSPVDRAIRRLHERSAICVQVGGRKWEQGKEKFVEFLATHQSKFVHVGYSGLMDDEFPAIDQRQLYIERIRNIRTPVLIEEKTLFGKTKMSLAEHWRLLVPADYKPDAALPCWAWFGAPPEGEDWV